VFSQNNFNNLHAKIKKISEKDEKGIDKVMGGKCIMIVGKSGRLCGIG
jgi:hypothetical protein